MANTAKKRQREEHSPHSVRSSLATATGSHSNLPHPCQLRQKASHPHTVTKLPAPILPPLRERHTKFCSVRGGRNLWKKAEAATAGQQAFVKWRRFRGKKKKKREEKGGYVAQQRHQQVMDQINVLKSELHAKSQIARTHTHTHTRTRARALSSLEKHSFVAMFYKFQYKAKQVTETALSVCLSLAL